MSEISFVIDSLLCPVPEEHSHYPISEDDLCWSSKVVNPFHFFFLCILAGERKRFCPMSILGEFYYPLTMCLCCPCSPTSNHRPEHPYLSLEATCSSSNQDVCAHQCPLGYLTMCSPHCVQCTVVLYSGCIIGVCANKDSFLFLCSILSVAQ